MTVGNGGDGNGKGKPGGEDIQALKSQVEELTGKVDDLKSGKGELESKLEDAEAELLNPAYLEFREKQQKGETVEGGKKDVDYEDMTPGELVEHLGEMTKKEVEQSVQKMSERIDSLEEQAGMALARLDLAVTSNKYGDWNDVEKDVFKKAKDNPTWSADKCYQEVKKDMLVEQEEKEEKEKKKEEEERKALSEKGGAAVESFKKKGMSPKEAAEAAYKNTFGTKE